MALALELNHSLHIYLGHVHYYVEIGLVCCEYRIGLLTLPMALCLGTLFEVTPPLEVVITTKLQLLCTCFS